MNKVERFLNTSGTYFLGNVLTKLIAFLLLPLYTKNLSPEEFGLYDLIVTLLGFFAPIAFFQIWDGMFRFTFDKHEVKEKYGIISNSFLIMIFGIIIFSSIFVIVWSTLAFNNPILIYSYGVLIAFQYQYTFIARSFLQNKLFVISGVINSLLSAMINLILIVMFNVGIESLYIAFIIGSLFQILLIEFRLKSLKNFNINSLDKNIQLEMIKFSLPLCISSVSYWMLSGYTKIVISQQLGSYENGLFAIANRFTSMLTLVITVFQYAWNEMAYLMLKDENRINVYNKGIDYLFKVVIMGSCIFLLVIKVIFPYIIDDSYQGALLLMPLSLIAVAFNVFSNFIGTIFMAEKITKWILWTTLISAITNVIFLWLFTPLWGLQGAVGALCLSFITISLLRLILAKKYFQISMSISNINFLFLLLICSYIFFYIDSNFMLIVISLLLTLMTVYIFREILTVIIRSIR